jgi:hypothetical protein
MFLAMEDVLRDPAFGIAYWRDNWVVVIRNAGDAADRAEPRRRLAAVVAEYQASR